MHYIDIQVYCFATNLPPFIGSMLRGAFGASLKDVVCINPSFKCDGCFGAGNCLYYDFFEAKKRFHSFRLDIGLYPKDLRFGIYLFNEASKKYPYILSALHRMLTQKGLGKDRKKYAIDSITIDGKRVYEAGEFKQMQIEPKNFKIDNFCRKVKLQLVTPLRIKREGRFVKADNLDMKDILVSIYKKRLFYDGECERIEQFPRVSHKALLMIDFTRYSNRQKTKMKIGGIIGEMVVEGLSPQTYEMLRFGEIAGVGKLGTFGLGKIVVKDLE